MMINSCTECLEKQREIDRLKDEIASLKNKLRYQQRKETEGYFGSSTPSSKIPIKANRDGDKPKDKKPRGGRKGHPGHGRQGLEDLEADRVVDLTDRSLGICPHCLGALQNKGVVKRLVYEARPRKAEKVVYFLQKEYCPNCRKTFRTQAPVLEKALYGNQLCANAIVMHYLHGIPIGRVCEELGIGPGSLVEIFHRIARLFKHAPKHLLDEYRRSPVKHADETGWRTERKNGYAWLFATQDLSVFRFLKTRSGSVAKETFGEKELPGVLVVDRYRGYNRTKCKIQYCYAHLLREVTDCEKQFPDSQEVKAFVSTAAPLLSLAMGLRRQRISDQRFQRKAAEVKAEIKEVMESDAKHLAIRRIQDIFRDNEERLYHWAADRRVPADNNLAERDLRPTVIARKVSFGSQSDAGAKTRGTLMSIVTTLGKRGLDATKHLKFVLDQLAQDPKTDPIPLLFSQSSPKD